MPFRIPTYAAWPLFIPDATGTTDGLMTADDKSKLDGLPSGQGVVFDVDLVDQDAVDVTFPGGFSFSADYGVEITAYLTTESAIVDFNIVPRTGDPVPPAAKGSTGFRLVFTAPVTGRVRIWAHR